MKEQLENVTEKKTLLIIRIKFIKYLGINLKAQN